MTGCTVWSHVDVLKLACTFVWWLFLLFYQHSMRQPMHGFNHGTWQDQCLLSALANLFSPKAKASHKTDKNFRCSASEALGLYPLLRVLLHTTVYASNHCQEECKAMFALADFLDLIQAVPHGQVTPSIIDNAAKVFLDACVAAGIHGSKVSLVCPHGVPPSAVGNSTRMFCARAKTQTGNLLQVILILIFRPT